MVKHGIKKILLCTVLVYTSGGIFESSVHGRTVFMVFDLKPFNIKILDRKICRLSIILSLGYELRGNLKRELQQKRKRIRYIVSTVLSRKIRRDFEDSGSLKIISRQLKKAVNAMLSTGRIAHIYYSSIHISCDKPRLPQ